MYAQRLMVLSLFWDYNNLFPFIFFDIGIYICRLEGYSLSFEQYNLSSKQSLFQKKLKNPTKYLPVPKAIYKIPVPTSPDFCLILNTDEFHQSMPLIARGDSYQIITVRRYELTIICLVITCLKSLLDSNGDPGCWSSKHVLAFSGRKKRRKMRMETVGKQH